MPEEQIRDPFGTCKRLCQYLWIYKKTFLRIVFLMILSTILGVIAPRLLAYILDDVLGTDQNIFLFLALLAFIYLIMVLVSRICTVGMIKLSETMVYDLRRDLFDSLEMLSIRYFDTHSKGDMMSRFTNDITVIGDTLNESILDIITSIITLVGVTIMMFSMNVLLSLIVIGTVPLFMVAVFYIGTKTGTYFKKVQQQTGDISGYAEEMTSGMKVLKAYQQEKMVLKEFDKQNQQLRENEIKAEFYSNLVMPLNSFMTNFGNILIIFLGAFFVLDGKLQIGEILAFISYAAMFRTPISQLAASFADMQAMMAGAERIFEVIDEKREIVDQSDAKGLHSKVQTVAIENVTFAYDQKEILKQIKMRAKKGEKIAVVGETGSGKTTIMNLLTRFYDIQTGDILINESPIKQITLSSLYQKVGILLQDPYLFTGTILENILYGSPKASKEEAIAAAIMVGADYFIHRLPDGYDTLVLEDSDNLSLGEQQLIAIARMVLRNPEILILDEATSNVDSVTEKQVYQALMKLMENRISFMIAHRLKTIQCADHIYVLKQGKIVEEGTHEELYAQRGIYYQLYETQFL